MRFRIKLEHELTAENKINHREKDAVEWDKTGKSQRRKR